MPQRSSRRVRCALSANPMTDNAAAYAAMFAARLMRQLDRSSTVGRELWQWAREFGEEFAIRDIIEAEEGGDDAFRRHRGPEPALSAAGWTALRHRFDAMAATIMSTRKASRVFEVAADFDLDEIETHLLEMMCCYASMSLVEALWDRVLSGRGNRTLVGDVRRLAGMVGADPSDVATRLRPMAPLRRCGLFNVTQDGHLCVVSRMLRAVAEPPDGVATRDLLLGRPQASTLPLTAFSHLGPQLAHLKAVLAGGIAEGATGLEILFYGAPGTGKTELSKTLAQELGVPIFSVGEADEEGGEPTRGERLSELCLALRLLEGKPALILCDEAEDIFATEDAGPWSSRGARSIFAPRRAGYSRAYIHRLLEKATVPIIFTANDLRAMNPATLRRISVCVELNVPPVQVRAQLWREAAAAEGVRVTEHDIREMASAFPAAPAIARSAMRTARLAGGNADMVRMTVQGVLRAMHRGRLPASESTVDIDLGLLSADVDLADLAERLAAPEAPRRVSMLLSGPPGSGKSAFARHLAGRMGLPVLQKRASDLFDMYVGGTEQRIAAAFDEARQREAFLIFDEVDSLLAPREAAHRAWEVSQVNEMLTWTEQHPLPFAATTNLLERGVDSAAMRRFLIKSVFGYLSAAQVGAAFSRFFGLTMPSGAIGLDCLTPADFDVVKRGAALRGELGDVDALLRALRAEQAAKPRQARAVGFMR